MPFIKNESNPLDRFITSRSMGNYNIASALCDLIDNSINAEATKIFITANYNKGDPIVEILDNGKSMTKEELIQCMKLPSRNPEKDKRQEDDLGRFGMGLKSASFSQCRKFSVLAKRQNQANLASWDLDSAEIKKSEMYLENIEISKLNENEKTMPQFTKILWTKCDRLSENYKLKEDEFNQAIVSAETEISLIFHRILSGLSKFFKKVTIILNNIQIEPHDPFFINHPATQTEDPDTYPLGQDKGFVTFKPYILPHFSKINDIAYKKMDQSEGAIKNQGFYVFRNDRLVIYGTWFNLKKHTAFNQLIRIAVDIPNNIDMEWKITIDKSDAQLPSVLRRRFKDLIDKISRKSTRVYKYKDNKIDKTHINFWNKIRKHGNETYNINLNNPSVIALKDKLDDDSLFEAVFKMLECQLPIADIQKTIENNKEIIQSIHNREEFLNLLKINIPLVIERLNTRNIDEIKKSLKKTYITKITGIL